MDVIQYMQEVGQQARQAAQVLARATTQQKNQALCAIADELAAQRAILITANQQDLTVGREQGLDAAMFDRLTLNDNVLNSTIEGVR